MHRVRAVRRGVPGPNASTCGGPTTRPTIRCRPASATAIVYEINYLRCIHCDLCVEACPTEAITESKLFEFSFTSRDRRHLHQGRAGGGRRRPPPAASLGTLGIPATREHTSAWVRATSAIGSGRYEGSVAWSGELGYGIRPLSPERGQRPRPADGHGVLARRALTRRSRRWRPLMPDRRARRGLMPAEGSPLMETACVHRVRGHRVLAGALGVVLARNPVHAALSLVGTLFGVAVAVPQPGGPLPGRSADHRLRRCHRGAVPVRDHAAGCRQGWRTYRWSPSPASAALAALVAVGTFGAARHDGLHCWPDAALAASGPRTRRRTITGQSSNLRRIADVLFTDYVYAFEATAALLTISVVGAVVMSRRMTRDGGAQENAGED